jgi:hypothetical protein
MASADVFLAFGADVGGLEAGLAQAQAAIKATTAEMRSLAAEMVKTGASADSELGSRLAALGSKLSEAKENVTGFKDELKGAGEAGGGSFLGGMVEKVKDFLAPLNEAKLGLAEMGEAVAAAFAVEKIVEFVKHMGELGEQTERTAMIFGLTTEQVGQLNYAFAITGTDAGGAIKALERFQPALAAAEGGTGKVAEGLHALGLRAQDLIGLPLPEQLNIIADAVSKFADSTTKTAALQALGRNFVELLPLLDQGSEGFRRAAAAADAAGVTFNDFSKDELTNTQHAVVDLGQSIEGLGIQAFLPMTDAIQGAIAVLRDLMQTFIDSVKNGGDLAQILYAISDAIRVVVTGIAVLIATFKDMATIAAGALNSILDYFQGLGSTVRAFFTDLAAHDMTFSGMAAASHEANEKVKKDFEDMSTDVLKNGWTLAEEFRKIWKGFGDEAEEAAARAKTAVGGVSADGKPEVPEMAPAAKKTPWEEATAEVERLTEALKANADALAGRKPAVDTTFFEARGGRHGAAEEAPIFADALEKAVKDAEEATGQKAVFTSLARTLAEQQKAYDENAAKPGGIAAHPAAVPGTSMHEVGGAADLQAGPVLDWLHAHISNYPSLEFLTGRTGANDPGHIQYSGGRAQLSASKASAEGPAGPPPTGAEREKLLEIQKDLNLQLDKAKQKLLDIKTEEAGGTETAKTRLAIAEADAKQKTDAVADAKKLQAAAEADLANAEKTGATQERITKLKTEVAKATEAVTTAESKQAESAARLDAAKAKQAGDIDKEKAAEIALADLKIKAAGADVAARQAAEAEKLAIETRYAEQSKSLAMQKAQEEIAAARTAAQNKIKDIDLEFRAKQISESQKLAMTKAALADEIAAERSIYAQELALDNLRPPERQKILSELQAAETKYAQQVKETQLKAAEDAQKAWQKMADTISGALSSQVSGIMNGTTTMKQAFSNMAKSMAEDAVKFALKWVTEHAFAVTQNMASSAALNASQIAGNTAVAASQTASGAAGIASQAANATSSIAIDGAKTFGGVFGFLAPLLGPFAAGPAAGAQATVLAAGAAFDVGAWDLPKDMIAAVHAGEMVIPSRGGVADEFRSFMSGGGFDRMGRGDVQNSGGNRSVSIHPAVNLNIAANDGQSVQAFFANNHKTIMSTIDRAVRHGSALGLRSFTR